jgi:hypothetical protein
MAHKLERDRTMSSSRLLTRDSLSSIERKKDRGQSVSVVSAVDKAIKHTFDENETVAFAEHITTLVKGDPDLADILPITPQNLFDAVSKGVLLWYEATLYSE